MAHLPFWVISRQFLGPAPLIRSLVSNCAIPVDTASNDVDYNDLRYITGIHVVWHIVSFVVLGVSRDTRRRVQYFEGVPYPKGRIPCLGPPSCTSISAAEGREPSDSSISAYTMNPPRDTCPASRPESQNTLAPIALQHPPPKNAGAFTASSRLYVLNFSPSRCTLHFLKLSCFHAVNRPYLKGAPRSIKLSL